MKLKYERRCPCGTVLKFTTDAAVVYDKVIAEWTENHHKHEAMAAAQMEARTYPVIVDDLSPTVGQKPEMPDGSSFTEWSKKYLPQMQAAGHISKRTMLEAMTDPMNSRSNQVDWWRNDSDKTYIFERKSTGQPYVVTAETVNDLSWAEVQQGVADRLGFERGQSVSWVERKQRVGT